MSFDNIAEVNSVTLVRPFTTSLEAYRARTRLTTYSDPASLAAHLSLSACKGNDLYWDVSRPASAALLSLF